MPAWIYYVLGVGVGFVVVLLLNNFRVALEYLVMVAKAAVILFVLMLFGSLLGFWEVPQPVRVLTSGLRGLWEPFQRNLLDWLNSVFG
jgi:hypothetical protein